MKNNEILKIDQALKQIWDSQKNGFEKQYFQELKKQHVTLCSPVPLDKFLFYLKHAGGISIESKTPLI